MASQVHPLEGPPTANDSVTPVLDTGHFDSTRAEILERIGRNPGMLNRTARRMQVLHKYTVKEDSPAMSSVLANVGEEAEYSEADRNRMKLSRLMALGAGESSLHGAQIELISIIERMDNQLKGYWDQGDRVRALRIAIQAIKVLGHTRVPTCYPSVFMLAATVLDTFGDLVADRIAETAKAQSPLVKQLLEQGKQPDPAIIPPQAVEMCNNWFLKILSIRELLPRVYVELSLMRSYRYVAKKFRIESMRAVVERLAMQVRGVADPLVAVHARWYVCLRAKEVLMPEDPHWGEAMLLCVEDTMQLIANLPPSVYEVKGLRRSSYVALFVPALQWLIDTVAKHSKRDVAEQFLERGLKMMESQPSLCHSSLAHIFTAAFDAPLVVDRVHRFMALIANADLSMTFDLPRLNVVANLCHALAEMPAPLPFTKNDKMALINNLWEFVHADSGNLEGFLMAARGLLRLLAVHTSHSQVAVLVGAIVDRILEAQQQQATAQSGDEGGSSPTRSEPGVSATRMQHEGVTHGHDSDHLPTLINEVMLTIACYVDGSAVLSMWPQLLPLHAMLTAGDRDVFLRRLLRSAPASARFSTTVLDLCRQLHDRLSDETPASVTHETTQSIGLALRNCFSDDVEQQLRFLGDSRHGLSQLDEVKVTTVEEALRLVRHLHSVSDKKVKRSHVKACFAFCHATVPGINDTIRRLRASAGAAGLAFQLGYVGQAEALLLFAINGLKDLTPLERLRDGTTRNNERAIVNIALSLIGQSAAAPAHAKFGPLYGLIAIAEWANEFSWPERSQGGWRVGAAALGLLGSLRSGALPTAFAKCPKPSLLLESPGFESAASTLALNASNLILRDLNSDGFAALAAIESSLRLYTADKRTGKLLQRALRMAMGGQCSGDGSDDAFGREKDAVVELVRSTLGEEKVNELIDGDDIAGLQVQSVADREDDDEDDGAG